MRSYIDANLKVIRKHVCKRKKYLSKLNKISLAEEFKEWNNEPLPNNELIWTLPDLTKVERFNNFCRSINKEIK